MVEPLNILFLGDVVGKPGRKAVCKHLPFLRKKLNLNFVICNAENAAGGFGVTAATLAELYGAGVDVITLGDHTWDKPNTEELLQKDWRLLRPANYPDGTPGRGAHVFPVGDGRQVAVVNLLGRSFMRDVANVCPFTTSKKLQDIYDLGNNCDALVVDIHAEATAEKCALAGVWDGKASLVTGSHTHIPTADAHIMPKGTGYQTDAGMCGAYFGTSLGADLQASIDRFTKVTRTRMRPAEGEGTLAGTFVSVNGKGLCAEVRPIRIGGVLREAL